jgi:hypothetical protein
MKQQINEFKRMQLIAGLITESEYRQSLSEEMELPKVGDKFSYEGDEIQITGVDDKFVDAKSTKKDKTYNFGLRSWKEGFKGSKLNEMDEAEKMDEAEDTLSSFKSLDQMNDYLEKDGWDPYEVADEQAEKKGLMLINKYIKSNILDKGKTLSPNKLNALLIKIEDLLP